MKMHPATLAATLAPGIALLMLTAQPAMSAEAPADPAAVVKAFNDAVTKRDLNAVQATFAPGAVQMQLRAVHAGMGGPPPGLTSDLRTQWAAIAPVIFNATKSYVRKAEILESHVDGDFATVWSKVTIESVREKETTPRKDSYTEFYVFAKKDGKWLIAAMGDNRGTIKANGGK